MELVTLNENFQMARPVEGHSSLIWTERYSTYGDFQRVSTDVGGTLELLPLDSVVSLRDTHVPMIVEAHRIDKSLTEGTKITTIGRSFETVLERRTTIKDPLGNGMLIKPWFTEQTTAVDAAYDVMNKVVNQGSSNVADKIPELTIKSPFHSIGWPTEMKKYQVDPGELYSWAMDQINSEKWSIRTKRPSTQNTSTITLEFYRGIDKTTSVIFDSRFDQFVTSTYLLSKAAWKNVDQVGAASDSAEVDDGTAHTGLDRRTLYYDASSSTAGIPKSTDTDDTLNQLMHNLGTVDLAKNLETVLFTGEVARQTEKRYGVDYNLGDIVKLTGDYKLSQFVRVSEFIRSEDGTGEKAYPTFESL